MSESISIRSFLFDDEDRLHFIPRRIANGPVRGTDRTPQFSNKRLRVATAMVRLSDCAPVDMAHVDAYDWTFDDRGSPHAAFVEEMGVFNWIDGPEEKNKIVSIERVLAQRLRQAKKWQPSSRDITRIVHAIWPEQAGGQAIEKPQRVHGVAKKRYPMSYEAKDAVRKCSQAIREITWAVGELGEHGLKGVISNIEQRHELSQDEPLWAAIKTYAESEIELRRRRRLKKGNCSRGWQECHPGPIIPGHPVAVKVSPVR